MKTDQPAAAKEKDKTLPSKKKKKKKIKQSKHIIKSIAIGWLM